MSVEMIAYTKMTDTFSDKNNLKTLEDLIVYCSKFSSPDTSGRIEKNEVFIKNLIDHKHFSPFEMVNVTMYIETSADIARKLLKHRSFSFQEVYGSVEDSSREMEFLFKTADKHTSPSALTLDEFNTRWRSKQKKIIEASTVAYQWAIYQGVSHDQAKSMFPEGLIISHLYMQGTIKSFIFYIENIKDSTFITNQEKEISENIAIELAKLFPTII